jgi:hypothetical protein
MGLAASHRLFQAKHPLITSTHQAFENLPQQDYHASRQVGVGEEFLGIELGQIGEFGNGVAVRD